MSTLRLLSNEAATVPAATSWYLADLGEARGQQELFTRQAPQRLKTLREHALIESAVSSNRIEGVTVEPGRVRELILGQPLLRDRDEEEVRGYRDALTLIHENPAVLPVSDATIQKLHGLARGEIWDAGKYKDKDGDIIGVSGTSKEGEVIFHSKVIVDASGFSSTVSKAMGFVTQWERFGAGAEYEAEVENVDQETWWLMVGKKYSPAGYAWIFPVGKNIVRIGVGVGKPESPVDPTERLKELMDSKIGPISKLGKITPIEFHYGLIPNDRLSRKTVYNNLILVGDSAGQANPLVLEGIRYAIKFGRVAGKIASDAIKSGKTDEIALYPYEENWKSSR